jgi:hypothetical protein
MTYSHTDELQRRLNIARASGPGRWTHSIKLGDEVITADAITNFAPAVWSTRPAWASSPPPRDYTIRYAEITGEITSREFRRHG